MSILKGILHHWNKTNKSYDTIHPETEVAQITDFNQGIINTLASTALGGLVNTLTSDSLMGTILQKVLTASGVKYLAAQNGYLCLGKFFGGIIIQWGLTTDTGNTKDHWTFNYPLSMKSAFSAVIQRFGGDPTYCWRLLSVTGTHLFWTDAQFSTGQHGGGDNYFVIVIGS